MVSREVEDLNRRLLRARDAMDRSYAEPLDVRAVAAVAHLSEAHFIRSFRAAFGETPHRYLQRRRLERSMSWLPAAATASYHEGHPHQVSQRRKRAMITKLNVTSIMVLNKDEALDFYVNKLGLEKGQDVKQGSYRWLTVRVPGDVTEISIEEPGPPLHDEVTAAQLRELITKGALGGLVFKADDIRGLYETLKSRGVTDFTQEPTDHFYGTDMGVRDPFGNAIRILQQGKVDHEAKA